MNFANDFDFVLEQKPRVEFQFKCGTLDASYIPINVHTRGAHLAIENGNRGGCRSANEQTFAVRDCTDRRIRVNGAMPFDTLQRTKYGDSRCLLRMPRTSSKSITENHNNEQNERPIEK